VRLFNDPKREVKVMKKPIKWAFIESQLVTRVAGKFGK